MPPCHLKALHALLQQPAPCQVTFSRIDFLPSVQQDSLDVVTECLNDWWASATARV